MRVPDSMRECVAFLGVPKLGSADEVVVGGTAFFVSVPSERTHSRRYEYLVTSQHCLDEIGTLPLSVRLNAWEVGVGAQDIPLSEKTPWYRHPSDEDADALRVDLAVRPWDACHEEYNYGALPKAMFATDEVINKLDIYGTHLGVGDEVFIIGLFTKVTGRRINMPIVRIGNVAMMPEEPIPTELGDMDVYLIEARSIGGLSGSPCFIRYTPEIDSANFYLFGLMHGHWQIPVGAISDVATDAAKDGAMSGAQHEAVNMGIGIVVPAKRILETLYHPDLIAARARMDREAERENLPTPDQP